MNSKTIRLVVILGALAIIGIISIQSYWVAKSWRLQEEQFNQNVNDALQNTCLGLSEIHDFNLTSENLVNQERPGYYVVNINNHFKPTNLDYFLRKSLRDQGIHLGAKYGVYDCSKDKIVGELVNVDYIEEEELNKKEIIEIEKPKTEGEISSYYFVVEFVNKNSFIMNNLKLSLFFSLIILLAIGFFIYAMYIILSQKRLSELQKDFINNMTHEFKTPISTIQVASDVFLKSEEIQKDKRLFQYAKIIKEQNKRLNDQVEKVLQIAKIEENTLKLKKSEVDIHEMLLLIVRSTEVKLQKVNGTLDFKPQASNPFVWADQLHLSNIVHNLLDNAIKYSKEEPKISVSTIDDTSEGTIQLIISDCGIGIPKEFKQRIFDKFFRVPTGNVHNVKGFGLGLFYIKSICEQHDWKINVDSKIGQGTTFTIFINSVKE